MWKVLGIVGALFALGCAAGPRTFNYIPDAAYLSPHQSPFPDEAMPRIELVKSYCYGSCPAYRLTIWKNGLVVFGYGTKPHDGIWWRSIPAKNVDQLFKQLSSIEGAPCGSRATEPTGDMQTVKLTVLHGTENCERTYSATYEPAGFRAAVERVLDVTGARSLSKD